MSESSFYECCSNFGTHTAACTRAALARMRRRHTPLTKHDPRDSDFGRSEICEWDAFERVTEAGLHITLIGDKLYAIWDTSYHLDYEYPFDAKGKENLKRKAGR
jgi:hypothetical protein